MKATKRPNVEERTKATFASLLFGEARVKAALAEVDVYLAKDDLRGARRAIKKARAHLRQIKDARTL